MRIDTLVHGGHLFTMSGDGVGYVADGSVAIDRGRIEAVGPWTELAREYAGEEVIDARKHAILPGLIDAHMHTHLAILRGLAQDTKNWMLYGVGPFSPYVGDAGGEAGSRLAIVEALRSGTTTFGDYGPGMETTCRFLDRIGVRAQVTGLVREVPPDMSALEPGELYRFDPEIGRRTLQQNLDLFDRWHGEADGRITVLFGPQGPDFLSKEMLLEVRRMAIERGTRVHVHTAQGDRETIQIEGRYGKRPVAFLDEIGYLDEHLLAVHLTDATEKEAALVARRGASLALCSGSIGIIDAVVPPARAFTEAGGTVALGSDQAPGNNCHNMWNEMKLTALFNKIRAGDPEVFPAWQVLRMATIDGARATGLQESIGSLEPGKRADLITVDLRRPSVAPLYTDPMRNIVPNLVYSARGEEVDTVLVDGRTLVSEGRVQTADVAAIVAEAQRCAARIGEAAAQAFTRAGGPNLEWMREGKL